MKSLPCISSTAPWIQSTAPVWATNEVDEGLGDMFISPSIDFKTNLIKIYLNKHKSLPKHYFINIF